MQELYIKPSALKFNMRVSIRNIFIYFFSLLMGLYSNFYYFKYGFPQVFFLYFGLLLLILCEPKVKYINIRENWISILVLFVCLFGLVVGQFNSIGVNYFISLLVLFIIAGICQSNYCLVKKIYSTLFVFSFLSVLSIYSEYMAPESFFSLAEKFMSTGSFNTVVHIYSRSNAYGGLAGYTSLASFSCIIVCAYTFTKLIECISYKKRAGIIINSIGFVAALFAVILTSKRSLFLAIIIAAMLGLICCKHLSRTSKICMIIVAIIAAFIMFYFAGDNDSVSGFIQRFSYSNNGDFSSGRDVIIAQAREYLGRNWIIGNGTGTGTVFSNSISIGGGLHNIYYQIMFENGIMGLILWVMFFLKNLKDVLKYRYDMSRPYIMTSLFIQVCFIIYGFFGNPLYDLCIFCSYILSTTFLHYEIGEISS